MIYFRYPLLAFLLGFASIGVVLLPLSTAAFGFFCPFPCAASPPPSGRTACCWRWRCSGCGALVTLPCYFLLAAPSWGTAAGLAAVSFGSGRRTAPVVYGRACWRRLGACCLALAGGVCAELTLSPGLLRLLLERLLG